MLEETTSLLVLFLLCLAQILEDAGKTALLSGPAGKMKRWTVSVEGRMIMFLAGEEKESTANLQLLPLTALWLDQRGCAATTASGTVAGKKEVQQQPVICGFVCPG